jgi:hypothetical protein
LNNHNYRGENGRKGFCASGFTLSELERTGNSSKEAKSFYHKFQECISEHTRRRIGNLHETVSRTDRKKDHFCSTVLSVRTYTVEEGSFLLYCPFYLQAQEEASSPPE